MGHQAGIFVLGFVKIATPAEEDALLNTVDAVLCNVHLSKYKKKKVHVASVNIADQT